jgi:LysM repeat protein
MVRKLRKNLKWVCFVLVLLSASASALASVYTVKEHDTLSFIVKTYFPGPVWGKGGSLKTVLSYNPKIKNPNVIKPGQKIILSSRQDADVSVETERSPTSGLPASPDASAQSANTISPRSDDQSRSSFELAPFMAMTSISSQDITTGAKDSLASNVFVGIDAHYFQFWNESFKTYLHGKFSYLSFAQPVSGTITLTSSSKFLSDFGLGATKMISPRFNLGAGFDLPQNLFLRAASTTSVVADSVLMPVFNATVSYDIVQLNAFILNLSLAYAEELKATTDAYTVGLGSQYGGDRPGISVPTTMLGINLQA